MSTGQVPLSWILADLAGLSRPGRDQISAALALWFGTGLGQPRSCHADGWIVMDPVLVLAVIVRVAAVLRATLM
jgi:hypothetical protein